MAKPHKNPIPVDELRQILDYNPETGEFKWKYKRNGRKPKNFGTPCKHGYLLTRIGQKKYLLHRLAWAYVHGNWPKEIDHINMDKTDNRICNLREATRALNGANSRCRARSGFKGVIRQGQGKYRANITINKQCIILGVFSTPEEAHARYMVEAKKAFGEFARAA